MSPTAAAAKLGTSHQASYAEQLQDPCIDTSDVGEAVLFPLINIEMSVNGNTLIPLMK